MVHPGRWFTLEVIAEGNRVYVLVDGERAGDTNSLTLDQTDTSGRIAIEQELGKPSVEFRKIEVKALPDSPLSSIAGERKPTSPADKDALVAPFNEPRGPAASERAPAAPAATPVDDGFVPLFNGIDTRDWKTHKDQRGNWRVERGILIGSGSTTSHLYTKRGDFKDFALRLEARINAGGNSGLIFRSKFGPGFPANNPRYPLGYEAQIDSTSHSAKTGSLFVVNGRPKSGEAVVPVTESPVPAGEWFTMDVIARGSQIVIKVNGVDTTVYSDTGFKRGHIALQQHDANTVVEFRKIEIHELRDSRAEPGKPAAPTSDRGARTTWTGAYSKFEQIGSNNWRETLYRDGKVFNFKEVARTSTYVEMIDTKRGKGGVRARLLDDKMLMIWGGKDTEWNPQQLGHWEPAAEERTKSASRSDAESSAPEARAKPAPSGGEPEGQRKSIFNGGDLSGWRGLPGYWRVKDGAIVGSVPAGRPKVHTFLCSKHEYKDFELKFRARLLGGVGNSGVQFRSKMRDPKTLWLVGPQCELCASDHKRRHPTGSLVTEPSAEPSVVADAGQVNRIFKAADFNDFEIRCVGQHVRIKLNGETTVDADFPSMPSEGLIGWQLHGKETPREVAFKNIEFTDLSSSTAQSAPSSNSEASPESDTRRVWVGVHRFENVASGKWLETSPTDPKETYRFDEVTRTPRYVELFDNSRAPGGCKLRLENSQALIIWGGRDKGWRHLYHGKWVSP